MHEKNKKANRLINEKSPYLLQHAHNPVDWYPWGEEAFEKAKRENKPIFLSIGYSTCHWCHVMERESFEDSTVAALMNDVFVSIKVDREERPDIDNIYMTVCQMMTGHGGWPLTILMTPDKKPFFAGTYFPKESKYGRMGLIELISKVDEVWKNKKTEVLASADKITEFLKRNNSNKTQGVLNAKALDKAFNLFSGQFDEENGGFGSSPKFPSPHNLIYLIRYAYGSGNKKALNMAEKTLDKMRLGGVFDHIGGGFHRYSTDSRWLLPHFEKMLYDQGMLAWAYAEAFEAGKNPAFKKTAEEIIEYVLRDMTSPGGGFYSAEDADSEGEEGKFYVWTTDEIREFLPSEDADLFINVYNLKEDGNFIDEASKRKTGVNISHLSSSLEETADRMNVNRAEFISKINGMKSKLNEIREKRIHPYKDDKILTDWNGLMIGSMAKAGKVFDNKKFIYTAEKAFNFVMDNLSVSGKLFHRYRDGEAAIDATLDDFAYMIFASIELYQSTFKTKYLQSALNLNSTLIEKFSDSRDGGFYLTSDSAEELLIRPKDLYDGAMPSGNSIEYYNLIRLYKLTADENLLPIIDGVEKLFAGKVSSAPNVFSMFLTAYSENIFGSNEIVIVEGDNGADNFIRSINSKYLPYKVVLFIPEGEERNELYKLAPFTKDHSTIGNATTVYVCKNFVCNLPTNQTDDMLKQIELN